MKDLFWERTDREPVYTGRVVNVVRDTVRIEAGGTARAMRYDVVRHPGAAAIVALFEDVDVALIHQFRYPVGETIWEIPAGTLDEGESFDACARRELAEEAGFEAGRWTPLISFYTTPGFCDEELRVFLAEDLSECDQAHDPDEHMEVSRLPLAEALEWALDGRIRDAKSLLGLHATRAHLEAAGRWP